MSTTKQPIKAVILDWAGTTVDHGSRAPTQVVVEIFRRRGIPVTEAEAREPMGRAKRDHMSAVANMPRIKSLWRSQHGNDPAETDIDAMYEEFRPLQKEVLKTIGAEVIDGIAQAIARLRSMGLRIGSSTGYTRELMDIVVPLAASGGYSPDVVICADDVPAGRPAPWMNFLCAQRLGIYPMSSIVVVDDTPVGLEAGLNAGAVTVGITATGNGIGLTADELARLPADERQSCVGALETQFRSMGVDHILPTVADLPRLIESLSR